MRRRLGTWLVILLYWAIVVYFLRLASPVFMDGGGPMPSFFWGPMPSPSLAEYYSYRDYYDLLFWLPYFAAGLVITIIGCGVVPILVRRVKLASSRPFLSATLGTLALILLLSVISDAGGVLHLWDGPMFFLYGNFDLYGVLALSKALVPGPLLAGIIEYVKRRIYTDARRPIART